MNALLLNWKIILPLLLVLFLLLGFGYMEIKLKTTQSELASAQAKNVLLQSQITAQNAAVLDMKSKAKELQSKLDGIEKEQAHQEKVDKAEIQKILNEKVPSDCILATKWGALWASKITKSW